MAYNFTPYRPRESNVEPGSLGIRIASLLMQGQNMKQENAFRADIAKQRELDRITEQQHQQKLAELASTFPTTKAPESYDQAVSGFSEPQTDIYDAQNRWIGQHAGEFAKYKGGIQLLNQFQQLADNTRMVQMGSEMRSLANKEAMRRIDITRRFGAFTPENEALYNTDQSLEEIQNEFGKENLPFREVPPGVINERGFINRPRLIQWKAQLQEDEAANPTSVRIYEDPENGQRYVLRGGQMIKSGVSLEAAESKQLLDAGIESIQSQMRAIAADPLLRFNAPERDKQLKELESKQQSLIKQHYDSLRAGKTKPVTTTSTDQDQLQSTDSNPVAIKIAPNGKKALFDSVTKKFLRYAE